MKAKELATVALTLLFVLGALWAPSWAQENAREKQKNAMDQQLAQQKNALEQQKQALEQQKQALEQRVVVIKQAAEQAALAELAAKDAEAFHGGGYGMGGMGRKNVPLGMEIRKAADSIRDAKNDEARADATNRLKDLLDQYFEDDMKSRIKELDDLEARLKKLGAQLDRRREKKKEIIDLQVKVALNEAEGLGFFGRPAGGNYGMHVPVYVNIEHAIDGELAEPAAEAQPPSSDLLVPEPPVPPAAETPR